jgi:hypothetical protein
MTVQIVTTEAGSAAMPNPSSCYWCDRPFQLRQSGGRAQRFCSPHCRLAFHAAARRWALEAIDAGVLTIDHIRKGVQPTCTLLETASAPAPMSTYGPGSDAEFPSMPAGGSLATSSRAAAPIIETTTAQIRQEAAGTEWE